MSDEILYRASLDVIAEGRTLVGLAVPWNKPAKVSDGFGLYNEAFHPDSCTRSLDLHKRNGNETFPFFNNHGWRYGRDPIGTVGFERSKEGLLYAAPLSHTREADEQLTLVRDGAKKSVSIGFRPIKDTKTTMGGQPVTLRTEVALRELSLAATGFGLHPDANVAAIRAADSEPYGAVDYADPGYQKDGVKRYPLDTEEHVRAAWAFINEADNAALYSSEHLAEIKSRIEAAGHKYGIEFDEAKTRTDALRIQIRAALHSKPRP